MFTKLPSNSEKLLNELVQANNPTELLCVKVKAVTGKDEEELMGIIRELRQEGYIDVKWADDLPNIVILNNSARTYGEQLAEYERQLQVHQSKSPEKRNTNKECVAEFIQRGERIMKEEYHHVTDSGLAMPDYISGPKSDLWFSEIRIFNERKLKNHPLHDQIEAVCKNHRRHFSPHEDMMGYLTALANDKEFWEETKETNKGVTQMNNKVFIVHGHDNEAKLETARTLTNGGFEPIILHEQPDSGRTIIEKIERFADVCYAVVLYTECDLGRDKNDSVDDERFRARQNVIFEHGYLISRLGRDHVTALVKGDVETPGDISGVVYTEMDKSGAWKTQLGRNMQDVGLQVDMNTFLK